MNYHHIQQREWLRWMGKETAQKALDDDFDDTEGEQRF